MSVSHLIYPMPLVKFELPKRNMTYLTGFGEYVTSVCYIWFIKGPSCNIIVDGGASAEILETRCSSVERIQSAESALAKLGLAPDDIDIVILTHLHHDHVALVHKFRKARVIVQNEELAFAKNPHPFYADMYRQDMLQGVNFETIKGNCQIAEGIQVLLTPGHTPGGQSVAVETAVGTAVITGFCCISDNFEPPEEVSERIPVIPPGNHLDVIQAYNSMLEVKKIAKLIIPLHDACFIKTEVLP